jgi:FkbM family methyltransferase
VTKAFYERNWRGINIEPLMSHYRDLQVERPRDINLCYAAGETSGEIEIFECDVRGWATAEQSVAAKHLREGRQGVCYNVPVRTLSDVCREYVSGEIHFLKIDVEGLEEKVIKGANFQKFRPWIVVIEATKPNSAEEAYEQWESLLLAVGYRCAYADGLNRFYVAAEHPELFPSLRYPPNVFDDFVPAAQMKAEAKAQQAEVRAQQAEVELAVVTGSLSWRLTRPLRLTAAASRRIIKSIIAITLKPIVFFLLRNPRIVSPFKQILKKIPFVMPVAKRLVYSSFSVPPLVTAKMWPRFTREQDHGELSVDTLLSRIRSELAQDGKGQ